MERIFIPTVPDAITAEWLSDVLGEPVVAVKTQMVGTGEMGDSVRLSLTYDGDTDAPPTLIAKLPAIDERSRATAAALGSYQLEVNFYKELAPVLPIRSARCHVALHDPVTDDFILLLEDLAPAAQGDQLAGCTVEQAVLAVDELPKLHAPRWGDPTLADMAMFKRGDASTPEAFAMFLTMLYAGFRDRYTDRLDPDVLALTERFMPRIATYVGNRPEPWTVQHGDYRLDNLLFGTDEGGPPIAVVDWQTVAHGPGISDLSYFIGAGFQPEDRPAHERDLVSRYHEGMRAMGVDLDWDDMWEQYRRYTFAGLIMAIAASQLVEQTERGDDMFMAMANRHGRHALELDAEALID